MRVLSTAMPMMIVLSTGLVSSGDASDVVQRLQGCGISMLTVPLNAATRAFASATAYCSVMWRSKLDPNAASTVYALIH